MNTDGISTSWLVSEVKDLLAVASVGLYEFIWLLRSSMPAASDDERRWSAQRALSTLLDEGGVQLVLLEWPVERVIGEVSFDSLSETAWDEPEVAGLYVALVRS